MEAKAKQQTHSTQDVAIVVTSRVWGRRREDEEDEKEWVS